MLRNAVETDAESIAWIISSAWKTAYSGIVDSLYPATMDIDGCARIISRNIHQRLEKIYVYEENSKVVGFISGKKRTGKYDCEVVGLYIHPDFQRQGAGTILLNRMESYFFNHDCHHMIIWTLQGAQNNYFYRHCGGLASEYKDITVGDSVYAGVGFSFKLRHSVFSH